MRKLFVSAAHCDNREHQVCEISRCSAVRLAIRKRDDIHSRINDLTEQIQETLTPPDG